MKSFYFRLTTNNNSTMMRSKQSLHTEVMRVRVRLRLAGVCPGLGQAGDFNWAGRRVTPAACHQSEVSRAVVRTWVTRSHQLPATVTTGAVSWNKRHQHRSEWVSDLLFVISSSQEYSEARLVWRSVIGKKYLSWISPISPPLTRSDLQW